MKLNRKTSKMSKTNYSNQKGITLIALVITIVVLLILAGVTINALFGDTGIINRAKDAQNKMDQATQNDLDAIDGLSNWIDSKTNGTNGDLPSVANETIPYYPDNTFTKLEGTDLSKGLVIKDAEGNEYVWIEVPRSLYANSSYNTKTTTADQKPTSSTDYDKIEYCLHKYTDYYRRDSNGKLTSYTDTYYSDETTGLTSEQYTALKQKMLKSVYENGGFWIGRYEAGIETNRTASSGTPTVAPLSKAGTVENPIYPYPYTYVTCKQAQELASKLSTGKSYTSSLMFGVQWDLVLKHIETKIGSSNLTTSDGKNILTQESSSWGNYYNASFTINRGKYAKYGALSTWYNYNTALENCVTYANGTSTKVQATSGSNSILLTTGASEECKKMNIYDLAGNVYEWTLEYTALGVFPCAYRGGLCYGAGSSYPASYRGNSITTNSYCNIGFRSSLYK